MTENNKIEFKDTKQKHDFLSAIRFFENLLEEIQTVENLEELKDPKILQRFSQMIISLKEMS